MVATGGGLSRVARARAVGRYPTFRRGASSGTRAAAASLTDMNNDERIVRGFVAMMIDAWNRGSAAEFAAPFSDDADFVAFEGTHLVGREQIRAYHERLFGNDLQATHLDGTVKFVHFLKPDFAVLHGVGTTTLAGQPRPLPSRDSMQMFVAVKRQGRWQFEAMLNARCLTLEQQRFADNFEALTTHARREVLERVATAHH
jgi:uncharacterized protein (TIGR02246 family)